MAGAERLLEAEVAGYRVELRKDGVVAISGPRGRVGEGRLDTVVLREWGEAHVVDCDARLGKTPDETTEIYEEIDDVLSAALADDPTLAARLAIPRNARQLDALAAEWADRMSPEDAARIRAAGAAPWGDRITAAEHLPAEQTPALLARLEALIRDE
jgi:hypothetical protein